MPPPPQFFFLSHAECVLITVFNLDNVQNNIDDIENNMLVINIEDELSEIYNDTYSDNNSSSDSIISIEPSF